MLSPPTPNQITRAAGRQRPAARVRRHVNKFAPSSLRRRALQRAPRPPPLAEPPPPPAEPPLPARTSALCRRARARGHCVRPHAMRLQTVSWRHGAGHGCSVRSSSSKHPLAAPARLLPLYTRRVCVLTVSHRLANVRDKRQAAQCASLTVFAKDTRVATLACAFLGHPHFITRRVVCLASPQSSPRRH